MFKKELKEIFFTTTSILLSLVIVIILLKSGYINKIDINGPKGFIVSMWIVGMGILILANSYGMSLFKREYSDRAFEYLLTFPVSRAKILYWKSLPRLLFLVPLTLSFSIVVQLNIERFQPLTGFFCVIDPIYFSVWVLFLFITGLFLGLFEQKNIMAMVTIATLYGIVLISFGVHKVLKSIIKLSISQRYLDGLSISIGCLIVLAILGIPFYSAYKKFDMKSASVHSSRYAWKVFPFLSGIIIASAIVLIIF